MFEAPHTRLKASDFQGLLREMMDKGCDYAVAEVFISCIGQKRADYIQFKWRYSRTLTGDHLDFHGTMESYFRSKLRLLWSC